MSAITDLHSHVLPGIDDGSQSVEQSMEMLRHARRLGVTRMVATPHFYAHNDDPTHFLQLRAEAEAALRAAMATDQDLPELIMGAEVYYFPGMSDATELMDLTIGDTCFLLVEMPPTPWTEDMYQELEQIELKQGLIPVLAHIDRYLTVWNQYGIFRKLKNLSVLIQANGGFFRNPKTQKWALRLLRKGKIHLLGSDCHDMDRRRPELPLALEQIPQWGIDQIKRWEAEVFRR